MSVFVCPLCENVFLKYNNSLKCCNNHTYDISKKGYVNLLLSQQSKTKQHGDDKLMINCRRAFLDKGYYKCLLENIIKIVNKYAQNNCRILDAGCGECYYTAAIYESLQQNKIDANVCGIDISKDALSLGSKRNKDIELAVASAYNIPVKSDDIDIVLNVFAPVAAKEYARILKDKGVFIRVIPLENHLWQLKAAVYDNPYPNPTEDYQLDSFELIENVHIKEQIFIDNTEDIKNVFTMTPYYYKTSSFDKEKLSNINSLSTQIEFGVLVYRKFN